MYVHQFPSSFNAKREKGRLKLRSALDHSYSLHFESEQKRMRIMEIKQTGTINKQINK